MFWMLSGFEIKVVGVLWILSFSRCLELVTSFWGHGLLLGNHLLVALGCGAVTGIVLALEITVKISHIIDLHYWNPRNAFLFQNPWLGDNLVLPFYSGCTLVFKSLGLVRFCNVFVSHTPQGLNYLIRDTVKLYYYEILFFYSIKMFISVMANQQNFQNNYSSLQCHMIIQKSI